MIIGIIGEAGSGKTTATEFFKKNGAYVISADNIIKYLYQLPLIEKKVKKALGDGFLTEEGLLNKALIRKTAFNDLTVLSKLEAILWPELKKTVVKTITSNKSECLIVVDCAVLFNIKLDEFVDQVLLIEASEQIKINRIKIRDNVTENEIIALLKMQKQHLILNQKIDYLVKNNGTMNDFLSQLQKIAKKQNWFACM